MAEPLHLTWENERVQISNCGGHNEQRSWMKLELGGNNEKI